MSFLALALALAPLLAQTPPPAAGAGQRGAAPPVAGQRGRGGRVPIRVMTLTTTAWLDGGEIPVKYSQAGEEASPPLAWTGAPEGVQSFVVMAYDADAVASGAGVDPVLHWLVWNIPATASALPEGVPQGPQDANGVRQISMTGPTYRGPAAPASGPPHHYVFEVFALDTILSVPAVGLSPSDTRTAVLSGMAGHVRGKGALVGRFRRAQ